jgi:hypothetical protein
MEVASCYFLSEAECPSSGRDAGHTFSQPLCCVTECRRALLHLFIFFETGFHHVAQVVLELTILLLPLQSAGITGVCNAWILLKDFSTG